MATQIVFKERVFFQIATLECPVVFTERLFIPRTVFSLPTVHPVPVPIVIPFIRRSPLEFSIRRRSVLLVRKTTSRASVVPMKFVAGLVPAFQRSDQYPEDHPARPLPSREVRTFPVPGDPPVIFICPATWSFAVGVVVPIPMFPFRLKISFVGVQVEVVHENTNVCHGEPGAIELFQQIGSQNNAALV